MSKNKFVRVRSRADNIKLMWICGFKTSLANSTSGIRVMVVTVHNNLKMGSQNESKEEADRLPQDVFKEKVGVEGVRS